MNVFCYHVEYSVHTVCDNIHFENAFYCRTFTVCNEVNHTATVTQPSEKVPLTVCNDIIIILMVIGQLCSLFNQCYSLIGQLCSPVRQWYSTDGSPVFPSGRPVVLSSRPVVLFSRPVVLSGRLVVLSSRPVVLSGQPVVLSGRPVVLSGRPVVLSGRPAVLSGWCSPGSTLILYYKQYYYSSHIRILGGDAPGLIIEVSTQAVRLTFRNYCYTEKCAAPRYHGF